MRRGLSVDGWLRAVATTLVLGGLCEAVGCGAAPAPKSWNGVAFTRRVTEGADVARVPGKTDRTIRCCEGGYLVAFTPDFSGYAVTSITEGRGSDTSTQTLAVKVGARPVTEIANVALDSRKRPLHGPLKMIWLTADGSELLVLRERTVERVQLGGRGIQRTVMASDGLDVAADSESVFVLTQDSPVRVRWIRHPSVPDGAVTEVQLDGEATGLYPGPTADQVLLWTRPPESANALSHFRLANLQTKSVRELAPPGGVVLRVIPSKGQSQAVIQWWDRPHELPDGTMKTLFSRWNYGTGRSSGEWVNTDGWEIQCTDAPCEALPL